MEYHLDTDKDRGALIVLEGGDRSGKTTQAKKLVNKLVDIGKPTILMCFPDRTTHIGGIINRYLKGIQELDDHTIHLLFSANRWELLSKILSTLQEGINVIVDRFAYSGVAFSAAKKDMNLEWCKKSDVGLPKPDLVLFLDVSVNEAQKRDQFGEELYENKDFQICVRDNYLQLIDDTWKVINGCESIEKIHAIIKAEALVVINKEKNKRIYKLWV